MSKDLKILVKRVGEKASIETIKDTLEAKQNIVNGLIEAVSFNDDVLLICNEEGKIYNMPPNLIFDNDIIAGDCFFVGDDYKNSGFKSLTNEQIKEIEEVIKDKSVYYSPLNLEKNIDEKER